MCEDCYPTDSKDLLKHLSATLIEPKFERWNSVSRTHIISSMYVNDPECAKIARQLYFKYLDWRTENGYENKNIELLRRDKRIQSFVINNVNYIKGGINNQYFIYGMVVSAGCIYQYGVSGAVGSLVGIISGLVLS